MIALLVVEYNHLSMKTNQSSFNLYDYFLNDERLVEIGSHTAIQSGGQSLTYQKLKETVNGWAETLSLYARPGDRVALQQYDST